MNKAPTAGDAWAALSERPSPFAELSIDVQMDLLSVMEPHDYRAGDRLLRQGERGEHVLLLVSGSASASVRHGSGDTTVVGDFGPGDVVGEMSLLMEEARTADVIARAPVRALHLAADDFYRVAGRYPELRVVLTNLVADRLGQASHDGLGGKEVCGYQIGRCVGRGGMGVVYEAARRSDNATVALKMMNHGLLYRPEAVKRFSREADILMSLAHPTIAGIYERFSAYRTHFLAMEFCEGTTLKQRIAIRGTLDEAVVRRVVGQLADALGYVHSRGLIHRDIKPANVVLSDADSVKLVDFGIAKPDPTWAEGGGVTADAVTTTLSSLGTPRYMAPEQLTFAPVDYRVDVYALASVVYEALVGSPVAQASELAAIIVEKERFVLPPASQIGSGVADEMHQFLHSGLEVRPDRRQVSLDSARGVGLNGGCARRAGGGCFAFPNLDPSR